MTDERESVVLSVNGRCLRCCRSVLDHGCLFTCSGKGNIDLRLFADHHLGNPWFHLLQPDTGCIELYRVCRYHRHFLSELARRIKSRCSRQVNLDIIYNYYYNISCYLYIVNNSKVYYTILNRCFCLVFVENI